MRRIEPNSVQVSAFLSGLTLQMEVTPLSEVFDRAQNFRPDYNPQFHDMSEDAIYIRSIIGEIETRVAAVAEEFKLTRSTYKFLPSHDLIAKECSGHIQVPWKLKSRVVARLLGSNWYYIESDDVSALSRLLEDFPDRQQRFWADIDLDASNLLVIDRLTGFTTDIKEAWYYRSGATSDSLGLSTSLVEQIVKDLGGRFRATTLLFLRMRMGSGNAEFKDSADRLETLLKMAELEAFVKKSGPEVQDSVVQIVSSYITSNLSNLSNEQLVVIERLKVCADYGSAPAKALLGHLKMEGKWMTKDRNAGRELLSIAADTGVVPARTALGIDLVMDKTNSSMLDEAISHLSKSANANDPRAMFWVAMLQEQGAKFSKDIPSPNVLLLAAARKDYPPACAACYVRQNEGQFAIPEDLKDSLWKLAQQVYRRTGVPTVEIFADGFFDKIFGRGASRRTSKASPAAPDVSPDEQLAVMTREQRRSFFARSIPV